MEWGKTKTDFTEMSIKCAIFHMHCRNCRKQGETGFGHKKSIY